jgi:hypothetical protein
MVHHHHSHASTTATITMIAAQISVRRPILFILTPQ